jgi:hypothetical protein
VVVTPKRTRRPSGEKTAAQEAAVFRRRLESIADRLLGLRFSSGQELWDLELELLALQRDTQASITKHKVVRLPADGRAEIKELRQALWHARRFGDSLAWLFFHGERRWIYPLSENARVPILPDGHASRGLVGVAQTMSEHYGVPLLHDVTDLLRVGDVTFFQQDKPPHTVEVKTELVESVVDGDHTTFKYVASAVWPADAPPPSEGTRVGKPTRQPQPALASKRFKRQLDRMQRAHAIREAELGKPTDIGGVKTLIVTAKGAAPQSHWPLIRRLIREAKRTGYASGVAESAVLFAVLYSKKGFESFDEGQLAIIGPDLVASGIYFEDKNKNALQVSLLPDPRGDGPHTYLPYFLYPLPRSAIFDLLHGRLLIFSLLNVGRLADAVERAGFRVEMLTQSSGVYLKVFTEHEIDGTRYGIELGGLQDHMREMIMEASSLAYMVSIVETLAEGAAAQLPLMTLGLREGPMPAPGIDRAAT